MRDTPRKAVSERMVDGEDATEGQRKNEVCRAMLNSVRASRSEEFRFRNGLTYLRGERTKDKACAFAHGIRGSSHTFNTHVTNFSNHPPVEARIR